MHAIVSRLRDQRDMTLVPVEHNMEAVMNLCDHICVLNFGRRMASGTPAEVSEDPLVIDAYLGVGTDDAVGL